MQKRLPYIKLGILENIKNAAIVYLAPDHYEL